MTVAKLLTKLTKLVQTTYKTDPTDPGVVISRVKTGQIYAAIIRFNKPFGKDRRVAYKTKRNSTVSALTDLINQVTQRSTP